MDTMVCDAYRQGMLHPVIKDAVYPKTILWYKGKMVVIIVEEIHRRLMTNRTVSTSVEYSLLLGDGSTVTAEAWEWVRSVNILHTV
jgi:hypothetical protein